jgi:hypothetical protein
VTGGVRHLDHGTSRGRAELFERNAPTHPSSRSLLGAVVVLAVGGLIAGDPIWSDSGW